MEPENLYFGFKPFSAGGLDFGNLAIRPRIIDWTPLQLPPSFTCFPRLPIEMRTLIWKAYDSEPRVLCFTRANPSGITQYTIEVTGKAKLPVLLQTTHESRMTVMKENRFVMKDTPVYFHLDSDIFYFDDFRTYDIYLRFYLTLTLNAKSKVENMVTSKEVATRLSHLVIDNVFGIGVDPNFDQYTFWGALRSVTICESVLEDLMLFQDWKYPGKDMKEVWADAWVGITKVTPALIMAASEDVAHLKEGGSKWLMDKIESSRLEDLEAARIKLEIAEAEEESEEE